LKPTEYNLKFL